jgi:hypothetical protein
MEANQSEIDRFEQFLAKLNSYTEDQRNDSHSRIVKWVVQVIGDLKEKRDARQMSENWTDGTESAVYAALGTKSRNMDPIY